MSTTIKFRKATILASTLVLLTLLHFRLWGITLHV